MENSGMKSRKLWVTLSILGLSTLIVAMQVTPPAWWVDLVKWVGVSYLGANAVAKVASVITK